MVTRFYLIENEIVLWWHDFSGIDEIIQQWHDIA